MTRTAATETATVEPLSEDAVDVLRSALDFAAKFDKRTSGQQLSPDLEARVRTFAAELVAYHAELDRRRADRVGPKPTPTPHAVHAVGQFIVALRRLHGLRTRLGVGAGTERELAQRVVTFVRQHPANHDQRHWIVLIGHVTAALRSSPCRTSACLAGWVVLLGTDVDPTDLGAVDAEARRELRHGTGGNHVPALALALLGIFGPLATWVADNVFDRYDELSAIHAFAAACDVDPGTFDPALPLPARDVVAAFD